MSLVFLHTADWQLGKPFASVRDEGKRHRLQQERLHVVRRLAELATTSAADFILIGCGHGGGTGFGGRMRLREG